MTDADRDVTLERFRKETEGLENVVGVAYDPDTGEYVALVSEKVDEDDLDPSQLVANNTSLSKDEHGVVNVGHLRAHALDVDAADEGDLEFEEFTPESSEKLRPVPAGAEEQPDDFRWVGTGSFIARVTDPSRGEWADGVSAGHIVRLSNWHVYVGDAFEAGRPIHQPFDGGKVGELVGGVPLEDGMTVDAAARTVSEHDGWGIVGLDTAKKGEEYGRSVRRDITDEHVKKRVTKSGRTTDVTTARIRLVDVSVNIDYGSADNPNPVRVDDCVITSDLGNPGDSGSPVFLKETGALCGLYFAGSDVAGVFAQIGNVEDALGIEPITDWDDDQRPIDRMQAEDDDLQRFKDDLISYIKDWSPS